jgi:hypothetical protein
MDNNVMFWNSHTVIKGGRIIDIMNSYHQIKKEAKKTKSFLSLYDHSGNIAKTIKKNQNIPRKNVGN